MVKLHVTIFAAAVLYCILQYFARLIIYFNFIVPMLSFIVFLGDGILFGGRVERFAHFRKRHQGGGHR